MDGLGNYAMHARFWDWGGVDRTPEFEYWYGYALKYGKRVLIPMCALGEAGAYMARRGMEVTAFDLTPEMIDEGKKRFGAVEGLTLLVGDVCDFRFDIPPADFAYCTDFGHLHTLNDLKRALRCIAAHLRRGGGLVVETALRTASDRSYETEERRFEPMAQVYPGLQVWKTGRDREDAETGRHYIFQTFYTEDESRNVRSFRHEFYLQSYTYEEWRGAFDESGFDVAAEYVSRDLVTWQSGSKGFRIFELTRR